MASPEIQNIFDNSDFVYMLSQSKNDAEILAKMLDISERQMKYMIDVDSGEGLIKYGKVIIPFQDHYPKDTKSYRIMSTKFGEESA